MQSSSFLNNSQIINILVKLLIILVIFTTLTSFTFCARNKHQQLSERLLVLTATDDPNSDGFIRFNRSVQAFKLDLIVLKNTRSLNEVKQLRRALDVNKSELDLVVLIVDSTSLIINSDSGEILDKFHSFKPSTRVLFSSDKICWPRDDLSSKFPALIGGGDKYLSSKAFMGYASTLWSLLDEAGNEKENDLQSYLTNVYLDPDKRHKFNLEIDHKSKLFQNLRSQYDKVELDLSDSDYVKLKNTVFSSEPVVIYGVDSTSLVTLNSFGNYLGKAWTVNGGCMHCNESVISLTKSKDSDLPRVLIGLFVEEATPFLDDFFDNVQKLNYPKDKIDLFIHNFIEYHDSSVDKFVNSYGSQYRSQQVIKSSTIVTEWEARNSALEQCRNLNCDYYFALDSVARIEIPDTLKYLIETNRTIVAPLLNRPNKLWSNFWGAVTEDGYYVRSHDYVDLVKRNRTGLWNVALIMNAYLIHGNFIKRSLDKMDGKAKSGEKLPTLSYHEYRLRLQRPVQVFASLLRESNTFQYLLNNREFGHLVDPTSYNTSLMFPDLYQLIDNMADWERHYLHENYSKIFSDEPDDDEVYEIGDESGSNLSLERASSSNSIIEEPCQDVFWFPLLSDRFCFELIKTMEHFGSWSSGTNDDPRIEGGYESVPTRDIHMRQVGLHEMWITFLREYVMPVQLKQFIGYEHDPPRADLAFVVRYHPAEQPSLRPHHDSSTYTVNIALNSPQLDYQGGGCRFVRYNCSVLESRKGWALIHPGRLTHYHEGLPVTNGTRYIMVTFVDP